MGVRALGAELDVVVGAALGAIVDVGLGESFLLAEALDVLVAEHLGRVRGVVAAEFEVGEVVRDVLALLVILERVVDDEVVTL